MEEHILWQEGFIEFKLDAFLQFNDADILHDQGKVTAAIAKAFAESEFEQYRVIQDRLYQSDFDRLVASTETEKDKYKTALAVIVKDCCEGSRDSGIYKFCHFCVKGY